MKILFQEVYLASVGGYLHVRVVSGVPPQPAGGDDAVRQRHHRPNWRRT